MLFRLPEAAAVVENPSPDEVKKLAAKMPNARWTRHGNINVQTDVVNRSKGSTYIVTDEPDGQNADEEGDLGEREPALPAVGKRWVRRDGTGGDPAPEHGHHRVDEGQLDVEDHEHERDQVKTDVEVDPGGAARRLAALVGGELAAARVGRAEEDAEPQHQPAQHEGEREEDEDVGELEVHRTSSGYTPLPTLSTEGRGGKPLRLCKVTGVGGDDNRRRALRVAARERPTE